MRSPVSLAANDENNNAATDLANSSLAGASDAATVKQQPGQRPAPSVTVQTPGSAVSGNVMIDYSLTDAAQDPCNIVVQFSPDGGVTWHDATSRCGRGRDTEPDFRFFFRRLCPPLHVGQWLGHRQRPQFRRRDQHYTYRRGDRRGGIPGEHKPVFGQQFSALRSGISGAPSTVTTGKPFTFTVTLENPSGVPFPIRPPVVLQQRPQCGLAVR